MMKKIISISIIIMLLSINIVPVYAAPSPADSGSSSADGTSTEASGEGSLDKVMKGADDFLKIGSQSPVDNDELKETSNILFNVLLGIAMIAAVIVGMVIGIKFMVASVDEKAKIEEQLVPYAVGCGVVFGAFGIWKLAITILATW